MGPRGRIAAALAALATAAAGCGGGERQDADEPSRDYALDITAARFPATQAVAERTRLAIAVRNTGSEAVPDVAVTIETEPGDESGATAPIAFGQKATDPSLADAGRPIWIVDRGPTAGDTAYGNTWSLGRLEPGATARFEWRVTAVRAGEYTLGYRVSPALDGTRARLAAGSGRTQGAFDVRITDDPRSARITADGRIVRE